MKGWLGKGEKKTMWRGSESPSNFYKGKIGTASKLVFGISSFPPARVVVWVLVVDEAAAIAGAVEVCFIPTLGRGTRSCGNTNGNS